MMLLIISGILPGINGSLCNFCSEGVFLCVLFRETFDFDHIVLFIYYTLLNIRILDILKKLLMVMIHLFMLNIHIVYDIVNYSKKSLKKS